MCTVATGQGSDRGESEDNTNKISSSTVYSALFNVGDYCARRTRAAEWMRIAPIQSKNTRGNSGVRKI
jgi:hypothetical protein